MLPGIKSAIAGGRPARKAITCARTANASDGNDRTSYTFASQSFGAVATGSDTRWVVAVISTGAPPSGDPIISGVTIGGVSATIVEGVGTGGLHTAIAIAAVPTGTTGSVVVTLSGGTGGYCGIVLYRALNLAGTAEAESTSIVNPSSFPMSFSAGSLVLGEVSTRNAGTATWVNLTEDYDAQVDASNRRMTVAFDVKTDDGSSTITCTNVNSGSTYRGLCVSFPAAFA